MNRHPMQLKQQGIIPMGHITTGSCLPSKSYLKYELTKLSSEISKIHLSIGPPLNQHRNQIHMIMDQRSVHMCYRFLPPLGQDGSTTSLPGIPAIQRMNISARSATSNNDFPARQLLGRKHCTLHRELPMQFPACALCGY